MTDRRRLLLLGALLFVCVAAAFGNALGCGFVFDDLGAIVRNPSLHSLRTALTPPAGGFTTTGRPLLNLSFAFNYAAGGLNPVGYHAVNLLIHGLAAVALLALVYRTTRSVPLAFTAALVWALHPLQTESVTYVSQRAESLMGLFYLLTLLALPDHPALSVLCCLAGMATKEDMASAPVIALLYDRAFLSGSFAAAWRARKGTYLALAATWLLLAAEIYAAKGRGGTIGFNLGVPYGAYLLSQASAIAHYLSLAVWPHPLIFDYGIMGPVRPELLGVVIFVVFVVEATPSSLHVLGRAVRRRHPAAPRPKGRRGSDGGVASPWFLLLWFLALLAPTSLVPGNRQTWAEHRMYLALAPLAILFAGWLHRRLRRWALPAVIAIAVAFAVTCLIRNRAYRSNLTLWADTVAKLPTNPFAQYNLGVEALAQPGSAAAAAAAFRAALALRPGYAEAHNNLGQALLGCGDPQGARNEFAAAVRLKPTVAEFHNNLGNSERLAADYGPAEEEYRTAVTLDPSFATARRNWQNAIQHEGASQAAQGRFPEAIATFTRAVRLEPDNHSAHLNLAIALAHERRFPEALAEFAAAVRLAPQDVLARIDYGAALADVNRVAAARAQYEEALRLDPHATQAKLRLDLLEAR